MIAHHATLRAHCHATEEEPRVLQALLALAGPEAEVARSTAEGHHKNPIVILEATLDKAQAAELWSRLRAAVGATLADEAEGRVDDQCAFYARFDKQRAFAGEVALTTRDDAIHLRSKLAAHPARKAVAVDLLRAFLRDESREEAPKA